jgi:hypothetical protein
VDLGGEVFQSFTVTEQNPKTRKDCAEGMKTKPKGASQRVALKNGCIAQKAPKDD